MNCALWLNKQKVHHASKIPENLDVASLRGYFLAGSLVEWLRENGGKKYAEKLSKISADDPELNIKIAKIFGGKPLISKPMQTVSEDSYEQPPDKTEKNTPAETSYGGSFGFINYGSGSAAYLRSSFFGGYWEFLQKSGTSSFGSFGTGSYSQWAWLFERFWQSYGSFYLGSFTSFHEWEWEWLFRQFGGSFSMSGFGSFYFRFFGSRFVSGGSFGSFNALGGLADLPVLDEYDFIMLETLMRCPLDRFGYGVHNI